ncbi:MAG: hypothetical protein Q4F74_02925 [Synergistaceae bacterium]|nr:hypothetical protein [Synergistaceae bacterium]
MFALLCGTLALTTLLLIFFGIYIFVAYVFCRLGEKFHVGSFLKFLIPIYNIMLLCDCGGISRWFAAGIVAPGFVAGILKSIGSMVFAQGPVVNNLVALVGFVTSVYIWGNIAKRLGKNFWLWGIGSVILMGIPCLFLAFDGSMPSSGNGNFHDDNGTKYIDV